MKVPPDWSEFINLLLSHGVRFLIVGAHALAASGRPRATLDLDVFVEPTAANAKRLVAALQAFGFPALGDEAKSFAQADRMATLGREPLRIDVMTSITGVSFREAWKGRLVAHFGAHEVPFLGLAELVKNKLASGRLKDQLDVELLREAGLMPQVRSRTKPTRKQGSATIPRRRVK